MGRNRRRAYFVTRDSQRRETTERKVNKRETNSYLSNRCVQEVRSQGGKRSTTFFGFNNKSPCCRCRCRCRSRLFARSYPFCSHHPFLTFETSKLCRRRTDTFKRDANRVGRFIRFSIIGVHRWRNDEKERRKYVLRRYPSSRFNQREGFSPSTRLEPASPNDFSR